MCGDFIRSGFFGDWKKRKKVSTPNFHDLATGFSFSLDCPIDLRVGGVVESAVGTLLGGVDDGIAFGKEGLVVGRLVEGLTISLNPTS